MKIGKYLEGKIVSVTMPNDDIEKGKKEIEELINEVRKMLHALINKLKEINNNKV